MSPFIEDAYPLSPMQEGMLAHTLYAPRSGVDIEQVVGELGEHLDAARFRAAWERVVAARPVLRTAFRWEGLDAPLQEVHRAASVPWREEDLRPLLPAEQEARLQAFLAADRAEGFDPARAPLLRVALFRTGEASSRLVWTFHHILLDGRSFPLVLGDVFAAYEAPAAPLPERRPYHDFIAWLAARDAGASESFWREALRGFTAPTPLLGDRGEGRGSDIEYGQLAACLTAAETAALAAFGARHDVALHTLIQGAWSILLSRYAGEADVVFGATRACRRTALGGEGTRSMVGLLINTLPLRVRVDPATAVVPWLHEVQRRGRALRDHEHTPLSSVQAWSELPPGAPLFETLLVFEHERTLGAAERAPGPAGGGRAFRVARNTNFPLALVAFGGSELRLEIDFDRRRFTEPIIGRMLGHLATVLGALPRDPEARLAALPLLTVAERRRMLDDWNATAASPPPEATLHGLFEAQVDRTPGAVALVAGEERLTYRALETRANRLANHLRARGVGAGTLVGLCVRREAPLLVALLAILKAGGAYVPLDPAYPPSRLAQILDDARAPFLVTEARVEGPRGERSLLEPAAEVVLLDADAASIDAASDARPEGGASPSSPAYVIYTSGSTGRPKGVVIEHRATAALLAWARTVFSAAETAGVLFATSVCFDLSLFEIFLPLSTGQKILLAKDALELPRLPARNEVTLVNTVPTAIAELVRSGGLPPGVRTVCLAGEPLSAALTAEVYAVPGVERVYNLYGPTEDTTYSTCTLCPRDGSAPTLGRPIAHGEAYLLDEGREPVPVGVVAEIHLGGAGLARGYLGRPDLTAERFVPSPFHPGARLYRTGDLGRFREDGAIELVGRRDFQVKLRGFRIELGEIEAVLAAHPGVRAVVVTVREDAPGDRRLVAYVVRGDEEAAGDLAAFVRSRLPEYMVPGAFVALPALPLTPNGKIDRRALPAPGAALAAAPRVAPRGPIEEALAAIFAEVLGAPLTAVGAHDDLFALGGHSISATRAVTRIGAAFGVALPLRAIFDAPTVAGLAVLVEDALRGERAVPPPLARVSREADLQPSFGQDRLWFLAQLDPDDPSYVVPLIFRLHGALDEEALERALGEIVRRHEVLRTTLVTRDGHALQIVHEPAGIALARTSWRALPAPAREDALLAAVRAETQRPFDLSTAPVLRAHLAALTPTEHVLFLAFPHIAFDAWSARILNRELGALYAAFHAGEPSPLAELPIQYADYAAWQRGWLRGPVLDRQLAYWKEQLAGAPAALELPADRPRPRVRSSRGAQHRFAIEPGLTRALEALARRERVTLFMTLLAAFDVLLQRYTGQDDLVVGSPIAGRTRAETEDLIGFFLNTLVLRARLAEVVSFRDLLQQVRATCLGAYAHQDMPFERLVQELHPDPDPGRSPVFQVIFNLQNTPREALSLPGIEVTPVETHGMTVKVDLSLIMAPRDGGLAGVVHFSTNLFDASTVERLVGHFVTLLEGVAADAADAMRPLGELPLLGADERHRLLVTWNETAAVYPEGETIHGLFEARAHETPEAIALVAGDERLSFRELDARANRVAQRLRALGVGPDAAVGLAMDRSAGLVVGLLGILKAGGAYVPLDPRPLVRVSPASWRTRARAWW